MTEDYTDVLPPPDKRGGKGVPDRLNTAVAECVMFDLDRDESHAYIKGQYGEDITDATFEAIRDNLGTEAVIKEWLSEQCKVGVIKNNKDNIQRLEYMLKTLNRLLLEESSKPTTIARLKPDGTKFTDKDGNPEIITNKDKDRHMILDITSQINICQQALSEAYRGCATAMDIDAVLGEEKDTHTCE